MGRSTLVNAEALVTWIKKQKSRAKYDFVNYKRTKNMRKKNSGSATFFAQDGESWMCCNSVQTAPSSR